MIDFRQFKQVYERKEVEIFKNSVQPNPLVSVLVQTYNQENFIEKCLNNILNQKTNFEFEILLGEDNSSDRTREICRKYAELYPSQIRLFLHHRENNIKVKDTPTGNFNAFYNLLSAKGDFIAFCEGDDYWSDREKLQKQVDFLKAHDDYIFTYHPYQFVDEFDNIKAKAPNNEIQPRHDLTNRDLLYTIFQPLLLTICFRNVLKTIPKEILEVLNADTFILSLLGNYGKAKFQDTIYPSNYRIQKGGTWSSKDRIKQLKIRGLDFLNASGAVFKIQ